MGDLGLIPGLGRFTGEGKVYPLPSSGLLFLGYSEDVMVFCFYFCKWDVTAFPSVVAMVKSYSHKEKMQGEKTGVPLDHSGSRRA